MNVERLEAEIARALRNQQDELAQQLMKQRAELNTSTKAGKPALSIQAEACSAMGNGGSGSLA